MRPRQRNLFEVNGDGFHAAVAGWFARHFPKPTIVQARAWPVIRERRHTLIAAPTGAGKTLAAFLAAIDSLVREGLEVGLPRQTRVLYVSPLKALSNDIQKNLQLPLTGIRASLRDMGLPDVAIEAAVRTGDTPQAERQRMVRQPPHILVTTPESLYLLLTSVSGRDMLRSIDTVIVDEIHALAGNKRGAHLALSLERLAALCTRPPVRLGLSATQKPVEGIARFLVGSAQETCHIIDTGHVRERDLAIEVPGSPLSAVMSAEVWAEVYSRLAELAQTHRTTLVFVNTRRLAERAAHHLAERLGDDCVTAHHGSLAREHRCRAEQQLKAGELKVLVATASLELGIDIGDIDLVCQLGSPRSIAAFLQRVGRSGHAVDAVPRGRLFPLTRDDLVECVAIMDAVRCDELDHITIPPCPLDVLAQQMVAEVASREWREDDLYALFRQACPYHGLTRARFAEVAAMLAAGYSTRRGRRSAWLHRDVVNGRLRARPAARLTAIMNGGAIADQFDYDVTLSPGGTFIGTLNEDFAFESVPGDIFQLGNTSYRVLRVEQGKVHVEDAHGQPPNIPFWFGEAPGRTDELSLAVSRLRTQIAARLTAGQDVVAWLVTAQRLTRPVAQQLVDYLAAAHAALTALPTQDTIIIERFFDATGDMHVVIHSSFGSRLNRAWGLALRKRFCRKFNFELQAAALEDSIVLSLGPTHSFPLDDIRAYLNAATVRQVLVQALLTVPMFPARFRWVASIALAVQRVRNGRRLPAQFQRSDAEDLIAVVFPEQLACQENIAGEREIPDHPLVQQALADCLREVMDIEGLERLLQAIDSGEVNVITCDLASPSPLAQEILTARPYAFLDDAPAEERRTRTVQAQRFVDPATAAEFGRLDDDAIARVCAEAWPAPRNADELHDALVVLGCVRAREGEHWPAGRMLLGELCSERRATVLQTPAGEHLWVAAERLHEVTAVFPDAACAPAIQAVTGSGAPPHDRDTALRELLRSRLDGLGPVSVAELACIGINERETSSVLLALETEGYVIRGRFSAAAPVEQWCERRLLARIHRYTLKKLRREVVAVSAADFQRFLFVWQGLECPDREGPDALADVITQLAGFTVPAAAWEQHILPVRLSAYDPCWLDSLCGAGRVVWLRPAVTMDNDAGDRRAGTLRNTAIGLYPRESLASWQTDPGAAARTPVPASAGKVLDSLQHYGASFFSELVSDTGMLGAQVEAALSRLVATGRVTADGFAGLRMLITPARRHGRRAARTGAARTLDSTGRWTLVRTRDRDAAAPDNRTELIARTLLRRYGVVFRTLLARETGLPSWRELLYVLRRLEARGEIRGGRFVDGFSGEQFALPDAIPTLRATRRQTASGKLLAISAADPLNLAGILTPGERVPALAGNRLLYRDGVPVAVLTGDEVRCLTELDDAEHWQVVSLLRRTVPPVAARRPASAG